MNEREAQRVVLVRSVEDQANADCLLSEADRRLATRAALEQVGPQGPREDFIAVRAGALSGRLASQIPAVDWLLKREPRRAAWLLLATGVGLVVGISADVFGSGTQLNLLAPPAWLVVVWNLAVYLLLCGRHFSGMTRQAADQPGWMVRGIRAVVQWWRGTRQPSAAAQSHALGDFGQMWAAVSVPLTTARLTILLHVASAAVAVGLIASMYLRGLVFDYRVGWGSTFLDATSVHALLSFLLAPALWISGIPLPDVSQMEALRDASSLAREQTTAAPWIHLYAVTLLLFVVLPRGLLAGWSDWRARRLSAHFPLSLDAPYYRHLLRIQRGDTSRVQVIPYGQALDERAEQQLRDILSQAFDDAPAIQCVPAIPVGGEDDAAALHASLAQATHIVAVFDLTATPEPEQHGTFLARLANAGISGTGKNGAGMSGTGLAETAMNNTALHEPGGAPVLVVVNEGSFASRFRDYPERIIERRAAWQRFAQSCRQNVLFLDLVSPNMPGCVSAVQAVLDEPAGR